MRLENRIPILWDLFVNNQDIVFNYLLGDTAYGCKKIFISLGADELLKAWKENPDWRFVQLLTNYAVIPHSRYYNTEDERLFVDMRLIDARDIYFWGTIFNDEGERLESVKFETIAELGYSHLVSILKHNEENNFYISNFYFQLLSKEKRIRDVQRDETLNASQKGEIIGRLILSQNFSDNKVNKSGFEEVYSPKAKC